MQFNTRIRKHDETVQMYVAELRRMAALCNFGEFLDRALRDRFIAGINNESIQQKILSVTDDQLTFATAFKIAQVHESACRNVKELQQYGESQKIMKITQRGKAPERERERLKRYEGRDRSQRDEERDCKRYQERRQDKHRDRDRHDRHRERERRETASGVGKNITRMCVGTERKNALNVEE